MNTFLEDTVRPKLPFEPVPSTSAPHRNLDLAPLPLPVKPVPSNFSSADYINPFNQEAPRPAEKGLPKPVSVRGPDDFEARKSEVVSMFDEAVHLNAMLEETSLRLRQNLQENETKLPWPSFLKSGPEREPSPVAALPLPMRSFDHDKGSPWGPVINSNEHIRAPSPAKKNRWDVADEIVHTKPVDQVFDRYSSPSPPPSTASAAPASAAPASGKLSLKAAAASFMAQRQQPTSAAAAATSDWQKETDDFLSKLGIGVGVSPSKPTADKTFGSDVKESAKQDSGFCICCASKSHSAGSCTTFSCLPLDERWTLVRQSPRCCTRCIVADHDFESCPTRKSLSSHALTCCDRYHDLLHKCSLKVTGVSNHSSLLAGRCGLVVRVLGSGDRVHGFQSRLK